MGNAAAEQLARAQDAHQPASDDDEQPQSAAPASNGSPARIDQPAKKAANYTVLMHVAENGEHADTGWRELSVQTCTSQPQARRKALDQDQAEIDALRAGDLPAPASIIERVLAGEKVRLVAVAVFDPQDVTVEQPPAPPPKIRC